MGQRGSAGEHRSPQNLGREMTHLVVWVEAHCGNIQAVWYTQRLFLFSTSFVKTT